MIRSAAELAQRIVRGKAKMAALIVWRTLAATSLLVQAGAQDISWSIPVDGGTPRDTQHIERVGPREFRIRASFEDGGQSVLRHAVSRVDLLCHNSGA